MALQGDILPSSAGETLVLANGQAPDGQAPYISVISQGLTYTFMLVLVFFSVLPPYWIAGLGLVGVLAAGLQSRRSTPSSWGLLKMLLQQFSAK